MTRPVFGQFSDRWYVDRAVEMIKAKGYFYIADLQRTLRIGLPRAISIVQDLENYGIITRTMKGWHVSTEAINAWEFSNV